MPITGILALWLEFLCVFGHPPLRKTESADSPKPTELFYQQKLDHFNPADQRRWPHRYLLNNDTWDGRGQLANGCPGPVLMYTGNEGPIDAFWSVSGFVVQELATKLGGLVLFPEERYYGKSLPFGNASLQVQNVRYLTTAQVLEDFVEIVAHIKSTVPKAYNCPVVAFGGSYGGTLTALMRAAHPGTVIGGLAASSELGYYDPSGMAAHGVNEFAFEDIVIATWKHARSGCFDAIQDAITAIDDANDTYVVEQFQVCEPRALGPGPKSTLFAYVLEGMPQGDYPSLGFPVTKACDVLLDAYHNTTDKKTALIQAAAGIAKTFHGASSCIPYDVGGPGSNPGDGPSSSAWGYQSCTECLHAFSARTLRKYTFDIERSTALCDTLYNHTVKPDLTSLAHQFGGAYSLAEGAAGVSHLIWSHGTLDPWHGWFKNIQPPPPHLEIYHILMEGSAHHTDLRSPSQTDPSSVTEARVKEEAIIRKWIHEATAVEVMI
eukprot:TRINITY_DN72612_c0_g1_i1.p1 TRINITY_DN72612_c0_g1~~TRINITY_DN72612_c0_g1_i1.p1  ORF type:complete len:503 (+),score=69.98 TRINITY_DN72612_c0_g1_i1:34-1509(+)